MLFNSIEFLVFLPVVVLLYFGLPHRFRWALLLVASYVFYTWWKPGYAILLVISTVVDYLAAIAIERARGRLLRRSLLGVSLATNLGLLGVFKYYGFFSGELNAALASMGLSTLQLPHLDLLLPVGISFYTFQTLSYTIDVYRGDRPAERHFGYFALYVSFFPQLVAGPIERSTTLLPQLRKRHEFDYERAVSGLQLIAWGLFKKMVIADNVALLVDHVYAAPTAFSGATLLLATYLFAFQIYCDFSGYSDVAIGAARILGIGLMQNFRSPYFARSIPDFWGRWHISLTTWFRDYLYIGALGGNRVAARRWMLNILIVFVVSGLWHGANWTFIAWGLLNGVAFLGCRALSGFGRRLDSALSWQPARMLLDAGRLLLTFNIVAALWIFFRAQNLGDALFILRSVVWPQGFAEAWALLVQQPLVLYGMAAIVLMLIGECVESLTPVVKRSRTWPAPIRWAGYYALVSVLLVFGNFGASQFIYFQF